MRLVRAKPFLLLALITIAIGALWHSPVITSAYVRSILQSGVEVIGAPFIIAMRLSASAFGESPFAPISGLLLGIAPYLLADWLLRRVRARRIHTSRFMRGGEHAKPNRTNETNAGE